jgi:hypothetical protein
MRLWARTLCPVRFGLEVPRAAGITTALGTLRRMKINLDDTVQCLVASTPHAEASFESDERLRRAAWATKTVRVVQLLIVPRHAAQHAMTARLANPTGSASAAAPAHLLHQSDDTDQSTCRLPTASLRVSSPRFTNIATVIINAMHEPRNNWRRI